MEYNPLLHYFPTVSETVKAIKLLSSGKAQGSDAIPAEIYKAGGPPVAEKLTEIFHIMWRNKAIPQEFKDAKIIHLFKRKGILKSVTIIEASLFCQLPGRSQLEPYWIHWMNTLNNQSFYQKASVERQRNNRHDFHSTTASREMPGTEMWTFTWPLSTLPKHLTQSVVRDFGKLWQI